VFEALFQGIVGSLVGVVLGLGLAFTRCLFGYGGLVFEAVDIAALLTVAALSFTTGIVISAVAAMWPSWSASRLAPMEAMRVE
jgi:ABC-type antimicrobial peptide transport system permease subunit